LYSAFFFELLARVLGELAADPPRDDFEKPTRVRARQATPEFVTPKGPAQEVALSAAVAADESARYMGAHLRAFERLQGARNDRAEAAITLHSDEAVEFAQTASEALRQLASQLEGLIRHLPPNWSDGLTPEQQHKTARLEPRDLEDAALAFLFLGGLRVGNLKDAVAPSEELSSPESAEAEVKAAPTVFLGLADQLSHWSPPAQGQPD
jgi:hypothetical protein